jgi:hypothetical protein
VAVDCFAEPVIGRRFAPTRWLAMTRTSERILAALFARVVYHHHPPKIQRAQGRPGDRCTRGPRAGKIARRARDHRYRRRHSGLPCAVVYGLLRALLGEPAFATVIFAHHLARELSACMGAPGPHDFAVRVAPLVRRRLRVHRGPPHVRDDRDTSLCIEAGCADDTPDLGFWKTEIFLRARVDRIPRLRPVGQISSE